MLPSILTRESVMFRNDLEWKKFLDNIGKYADNIDHDFLSQICYEHSESFNSYFPNFDINHNKVVRINKTTSEIYNEIRYYNNQKINSWYFQIDDYLDNLKRNDYKVLKYIIENGTWSFPPVVIKNELANKLGTQNFGQPMHLIEGTHRISFINRLYELEIVKPNSKHVLLEIM